MCRVIQNLGFFKDISKLAQETFI